MSCAHITSCMFFFCHFSSLSLDLFIRCQGRSKEHHMTTIISRHSMKKSIAAALSGSAGGPSLV